MGAVAKKLDAAIRHKTVATYAIARPFGIPRLVTVLPARIDEMTAAHQNRRRKCWGVTISVEPPARPHTLISALANLQNTNLMRRAAAGAPEKDHPVSSFAQL